MQPAQCLQCGGVADRWVRTRLNRNSAWAMMRRELATDVCLMWNGGGSSPGQFPPWRLARNFPALASSHSVRIVTLLKAMRLPSIMSWREYRLLLRSGNTVEPSVRWLYRSRM